jgi:integrase
MIELTPTRETCKRFLTKAEYHKLLDELHGRDRLIFRLFILCAFRPGELFPLRWRCFTNGCRRIEEAVYQGKLGSRKQKQAPLKSFCPNLSQKTSQNGTRRAAVPIPTISTSHPRRTSPSTDTITCVEMSCASGRTSRYQRDHVPVPPPNLATHFHRVGTVKDQQAQMRHKTAQVTMNVYTKSMSDSLRTSMEDFDR